MSRPNPMDFSKCERGRPGLDLGVYSKVYSGVRELERATMNTVTFKVEGMHCTGCAATIQALLERSAGVRKATVSFDEGQARVLYDPQSVSEGQLIATIEQGGYRVTGPRHD